MQLDMKNYTKILLSEENRNKVEYLECPMLTSWYIRKIENRNTCIYFSIFC